MAISGPGSDRDELARRRLTQAFTELAARDGYQATGVNQVVRRARVSTRTFYRLFSSKADCFFAACSEAEERAIARMRSACAAGGSRRARVERALAALLELCEREPALPRICLVEAPAITPGGHLRRCETVERLVAVARGALPPDLTPAAAHMVVGGVVSVVDERVRRGAEDGLSGLAVDIASFVLAGYDTEEL